MPVRFVWQGDQAMQKITDQSAQSLFEAAEHVLEEANRNVPHNEDTLERSGETSVDERKQIAAVSYDTPYAMKLHEHPEYNFQKNRTGKWLENAVKEFAGNMAAFIAGVMKKAF